MEWLNFQILQIFNAKCSISHWFVFLIKNIKLAMDCDEMFDTFPCSSMKLPHNFSVHTSGRMVSPKSIAQRHSKKNASPSASHQEVKDQGFGSLSCDRWRELTISSHKNRGKRGSLVSSRSNVKSVHLVFKSIFMQFWKAFAKMSSARSFKNSFSSSFTDRSLPKVRKHSCKSRRFWNISLLCSKRSDDNRLKNRFDIPIRRKVSFEHDRVM